MSEITVYVDGIGFWAPRLPDWPAFARAVESGTIDGETPARPAPGVLPPTERRRAPEPVLIASETAAQACAMASRDAASLACVFTSTHGDLAITDQMCETLADDPRELSPTRFHNSVHNAPSGYWTVATHCHKAATAISAVHASFAAGLLEAAVEAHAEHEPILLCAYDTVARGPLAEVSPSGSSFGVAFVLSPERSATSLATLVLRGATGDAPASSIDAPFDALVDNPMAVQALPFLVALASGDAAAVTLAAGEGTTLDVEIAQ